MRLGRADHQNGADRERRHARAAATPHHRCPPRHVCVAERRSLLTTYTYSPSPITHQRRARTRRPSRCTVGGGACTGDRRWGERRSRVCRVAHPTGTAEPPTAGGHALRHRPSRPRSSWRSYPRPTRLAHDGAHDGAHEGAHDGAPGSTGTIARARPSWMLPRP